jgi:hypothetical protein
MDTPRFCRAEIANVFESHTDAHRCDCVLDSETPVIYEATVPWRRAGDSFSPTTDGLIE